MEKEKGDDWLKRAISPFDFQQFHFVSPCRGVGPPAFVVLSCFRWQLVRLDSSQGAVGRVGGLLGFHHEQFQFHSECCDGQDCIVGVHRRESVHNEPTIMESEYNKEKEIIRNDNKERENVKETSPGGRYRYRTILYYLTRSK